MSEQLESLLTKLVEQMTLTNQFLAQVVAHNADMLDAGGEPKDDGPETLTNRVGSVGDRNAAGLVAKYLDGSSDG